MTQYLGERFHKRNGKKGGFFVTGLIISVIPSSLFAQSTVGTVTQSDGRVLPTAVGTLTPHLTTGRFGTSIAGGYLSPSSDGEGRFSGGAVLTPSGAFVGMDNNIESSRFGGYWEPRTDGLPEDQPLSQRDLLIYLRSQRNREATAQNPPENPQQVSAVPYDEPLPYRQPGAEETTPLPETTPTIQNVQVLPQRGQEGNGQNPKRPSEQIWMRGSATRQTSIPPYSDVQNGFDFGADSLTARENGPNMASERSTTPSPNDSDWNGGVIGGQIPDLSSPETSSLPSATLARNGRQERRRQEVSIQEYLESLILKSPIVSPLSPIRVTMNGSVATILGIVPTEKSRIEAGRILLADPRVESVNNQLTVFSSDNDQPLPPPFDPNLPESDNKAP